LGGSVWSRGWGCNPPHFRAGAKRGGCGVGGVRRRTWTVWAEWRQGTKGHKGRKGRKGFGRDVAGAWGWWIPAPDRGGGRLFAGMTVWAGWWAGVGVEGERRRGGVKLDSDARTGVRIAALLATW